MSILEPEVPAINLPLTYELFVNQPNPFTRTTEIRYSLPNQTKIRITVFNSSGQIITTLLNGIQNQGWYSVRWNRRDSKGKICPSGIYFYRLETEEYQATKKMVMMR